MILRDYNIPFTNGLMSSSHPHTKFKVVVTDNTAFSLDVHQYSPTVHNKN
jgi:hypothetical protein